MENNKILMINRDENLFEVSATNISDAVRNGLEKAIWLRGPHGSEIIVPESQVPKYVKCGFKAIGGQQ